MDCEVFDEGFQFHYGTIIRKALGEFWNNAFIISIPLWYDYKYFYVIVYKLMIAISIPLWYDYK